jgi:hypothetical protein
MGLEILKLDWLDLSVTRSLEIGLPDEIQFEVTMIYKLQSKKIIIYLIKNFVFQFVT